MCGAVVLQWPHEQRPLQHDSVGTGLVVARLRGCDPYHRGHRAVRRAPKGQEGRINTPCLHGQNGYNDPMSNTTQQYNGWANYATWNIALWISNDEYFYSEARRLARKGWDAKDIAAIVFLNGRTPDDVSVTDPTIDWSALDETVEELL